MDSIVKADCVIMETGDSLNVAERKSCPRTVFRIATEIATAKIKLRSCVSEQVLVDAMKKRYKTDAHTVKKELNLAVSDGLLVKRDQGYKLNELLDELKDHDYYCYNCSEPGEIRKCAGCWRVYHNTCYKYSDEHGKCFFCKEYDQKPIRKRHLTRVEINDALEILFSNVFSKFPQLYDESIVNIGDPTLRNFASKLIYNFDFNFSVMKMKVEKNAYTSILEFVFDTKTVWHNFRCLYGDKMDVCRKMEELYKFVLSEEHAIYNCLDCYTHAHIKDVDDKKDWFLIPCNPPHQLAFAKVEGYPPFPAKIMRSTSGGSHVWFFDERHEHAYVEHSDIYPSISVEYPISEELSNSLKELEKHKVLLKQQIRDREKRKEVSQINGVKKARRR